MLIYKITNKINGMIYIGQTTKTIKNRWSNHKSDCRSKKRKTNHPLYNAMKKYGIDNFNIEEIGGANNISELNYQEWLLIHKHNTLWPNGYNLREGGGSTGKMSCLAKKANSIAQKKYFNNNPQHNSKKVININTGQIWKSATECLKENSLQMSRSNFTNKLSGKTGNETPFRYLNKISKCKKPGIGAPKKIIDTKTGKTWDGIRECAKYMGFSYNVLKNKLRGITINDTDLRYLGQENICKKRKKYKKESKKVMDIKTGVCYESAKECAAKNNINIHTLRKWLNKNNNIKSRYQYG